MRKISMRAAVAAAVSLPLLCAACNPSQVSEVQSGQAAVQAAIDNVCTNVNGIAAAAAPFASNPYVAGAVAFATAECGTSQVVSAMVTKAVNDPTVIAQIQGIGTNIEAAVATAKAALSGAAPAASTSSSTSAQ